MLLRLHINNYALINEVKIDFQKGFTIITGETGAGKSILLDALGLLMGNRVEQAAIANQTEKTIIEAWFDIKNYKLNAFFENNDLDFEQTSILRREINVNGKSRAFINDTPVNLNVLKELALSLIDIHAQHETHQIQNDEFKFSFISSAGSFNELSEKYKLLFKAWQNKRTELHKLQEEERKSSAEQDYLQFQLNELENAKLQIGEEVTLEEDFQSLTHAEDISRQLFLCHQLLDGEELSIINSIKEVQQALHQVSKYSNDVNEIAERIQSALIEVKDINAEIEQLSEKHQPDPIALQKVSDRLDLIQSLLQKHRKNSTEELLLLYKDIEHKIQGNDQLTLQIETLNKEIDQLYHSLLESAQLLRKNRLKIIPDICQSVENTLKSLEMPNARFQIELKEMTQPNVFGMDEISFLFTANKGKELQKIEKVASGGELSRLMLAIKKLMTYSTALPTIIFDEIDSGVSGAVAEAMGIILSEMSINTQVMAITHLPQVAGKGNHHFKVKKVHTEDSVFTTIEALNEQERIQEVASMLSGKNLTDAAIVNARSLLNIKDV
jgi:DNA repair protein RecN (Recombination protein N)